MCVCDVYFAINLAHTKQGEEKTGTERKQQRDDENSKMFLLFPFPLFDVIIIIIINNNSNNNNNSAQVCVCAVLLLPSHSAFYFFYYITFVPFSVRVCICGYTDDKVRWDDDDDDTMIITVIHSIDKNNNNSNTRNNL